MQTYGEGCSSPSQTWCTLIHDATTGATAAAKGTYRTDTVEQQQHCWERHTEHVRADTALQPPLVWVSATTIMCPLSIGLKDSAHNIFFVFSSVDTPCPSFFLPFPCRLQACEAGGSGSWFHESSVVHLVIVCPYLGFPEVHSSEPLWQESTAMGKCRRALPRSYYSSLLFHFVIYFYYAADSRFQLCMCFE